MSQELYFLPATLSLSPIRTLIETSGFALNEIAVFFDFDQTLKQTNVTFLTDKNGNPRISKQSGQPLKESKAAVRGGDVTISFLNYLIDNGVKWYVNTARGPGSVAAVAQTMRLLRIHFSPIMVRPGQEQCGVLGERDLIHNGVEIGVCNNIVSAGRQKDHSTDYVISQMPERPKLIIFVDDNAENILVVYRHIKNNMPEINFKGVISDPVPDIEEGHLESMAILEGEGMPPMQDITAEYGASGGRRRSRKSRRNRKNRRGTRRR
jgi:hypothetical protein